MSTVARDGPRKKRPRGRIAFCVLFFIAGAWSLATTAAMNFTAGLHTADSRLGHWVQPSSTLVIDVMAALLAVAVCSLLAQGKWKPIFCGLLLAIPLAGFMTFSGKNVIGFGAFERMEKANRAEANTAIAVATISDANQMAAGRQERHIDWLKSELRTAGRSERAKLRQEITEAVNAPIEVQIPTISTVNGDAEAAVFAKTFNMDVETYLFWNQIALAVLLVLGKTLGFGLAAAMWPRDPEPAAASNGASQETPEAPPALAERASSTLEAPVDRQEAPVVVEAEPQPERPAPTADLFALEAPERVVRNASRDVPSSIERARKLRAVKRFVGAEMVAVAKPENGVGADELFRRYEGWAQRNEPACSMTQVAFSHLCAEVGIKKAKRGGIIRYALRSAEEVPTAKVA